MSSMNRDAFEMARQAIGIKGIILAVVLSVLFAPCILMFIILGLLFAPLEWIFSRASRALRRVGKRLDDPVFGPVTYQGYSCWHAEINLEALGGRVIVGVPGARATGPGHEYAELFRGLVEHQHEIARQAEQSIFREYQAVAPELRKSFVVGSDWQSESFRDSVPVLEEPAQIWTLLSGGTMTFDDDHLEQPGSFVICWDCTWGIEYGDVCRNFVNWKLEEEEDS